MGRLKKHIRFYHEQKYDHVCEYCSYRAMTGQNLKLHIKSVHEKIKDEQCHLCPATFSRKTNLQEHVKSFHEKIRRFQCEQCDYETNRKQNMKVHINTMHDTNTESNTNIYSMVAQNNMNGHYPLANENLQLSQPGGVADESSNLPLSRKLSMAQSNSNELVPNEENNSLNHQMDFQLVAQCANEQF